MSLAPALLAAAYLDVLAFKAIAAWWQIRRERAVRETRCAPGDVTVLVPILGGDPELGATLAACAQELVGVRLLWLVDEDDALGAGIAREVAARPAAGGVEVLAFPAAPVGVNPKTFKLAAALARVTSEFVVVLDDDARLRAEGLRELVRGLDGADLATGLPYYRRGRTFGGRLLAHFVNDNVASTYLPLLPFQPPVTIHGMCYALRTRLLVRLGGFTAISHQLADDLAIADLVRRKGGTLRQTLAPVEVATHVEGLGRWWSQMHRWFLFATLLLKRVGAGTAVAIVVLHGLPPLLLWAALVVACVVDGGFGWAWLATLLVARVVAIVPLQIGLTGAMRHGLLLSPFVELLQPLHLLHAVLVRRIRWRTRIYQVHDNDRFVPA